MSAGRAERAPLIWVHAAAATKRETAQKVYHLERRGGDMAIAEDKNGSLKYRKSRAFTKVKGNRAQKVE